MWGYSPSGSGWLMMILVNVLWIVLLGILVWAIIRWFGYRATLPGSRKPDAATSSFSSLEILRQRYARGEIDAPTFEQMRERLEGSYAAEGKSEDRQSPVMNRR